MLVAARAPVSCRAVFTPNGPGARLLVASVPLAALLATAGCGGSTTKTVTQTQTVRVQPTTKATSHTKLQVKQTVAKAGGAKPKFVGSLPVKAGDEVILETTIANQTKAKGTKLGVTVDKGPSKSLKVAAGNFGRKATASATLRSSNGKPIVLGTVKYKCTVAPTTMCPLDQAKETKTGFSLVVSPPTQQGVPIVFTATVGQG